MRRFAPIWICLLALASCGGSSGGGGEPEPEAVPNEAPVLAAPSALSGGPVQFSLQLPTGSSQTLTFTATDADGDALLWQVGVSAQGQQASGMMFSSPVTGSTFTIELQPVMAAATADVSVLVEDTRGAAAAIDLMIVRSGSPTITSVSPDSAFRTAPQVVTVTGTGFSLGNTVTTTASFAGLVGVDTVVLDETTLTCRTPSQGIAGSNIVAVGNQFGTSSLPPSAFTMFAYPVDFLDTDVALDAGAGSDFAAANDGADLHVVWTEGGMVMHRASTDGGATLSPSQPLTTAGAPTDPQVVVSGQSVTVLWIAAGSSIQARSSDDGGATFAPAVQVATGTMIQRLQMVQSGARRYCAWVSSPTPTPRVFFSSTTDNGAIWRPAMGFQSGNSNVQNSFSIGCDAEAAWILAVDNGAAVPGVYLARTTDGGFTWTAGNHRGAFSLTTAEPHICNDGPRVYLVWQRNGALEYMVSADRGQTWPTQATEFRPSTMGAIGETVVACEGERLFAAYRLGIDGMAFSRVGAAGAFPEHVTVSNVAEPTGVPTLDVCGSYALVAWRGGDVAMGTARIRFASSTDFGLTFDAPTLFGNGNAPQDRPQLLLDGARVWIGWQDSRGTNPALFANRTEQ